MFIYLKIQHFKHGIKTINCMKKMLIFGIQNEVNKLRGTIINSNTRSLVAFMKLHFLLLDEPLKRIKSYVLVAFLLFFL